jgi:hypothetical protein
MSEQLLSSTDITPVSSAAFDRLLRRAALNSRLSGCAPRVTPRGAECVNAEPIGRTAGVLWQILSEDGPLTFASMMNELNVPESVFFMAVGWLAREGKIEFEPCGGDYRIRLK